MYIYIYMNICAIYMLYMCYMYVHNIYYQQIGLK